ncbi:MAG TPA: MMPL family transporter [Candidatus Dormibacteraeota bacterium]|nr:MMPL family transporter [Candidatus Dormibacteraeota bacterium]
MLPRHFIDAYLRFLLRHRLPVAVAVAVITAFFIWFIGAQLTIFTNFFDLYPPKHPYIEVYQKYRKMFGTSNVLLMTVEAKDGDLFTDPEVIKTVDRITIELLHNVPGVNGEQVMSITHPKIKTTLTTGAGLKTVPLTYPRLPEDKEDLEFFRRKVDTTEGVRGFLVSQDDKATQIIAGFWEEYFDLAGMWKQVQDIVAREEAGGKVKIYVSGPPVLFAYFNEAVGTTVRYLLGTLILMLILLWFYFRTIQGLIIPTFSALLSAIWGLGFAGLFGYSLDPLVIVVFVLITARTLSHSVQSMERYHEEYFRCQDKHTAIMRSYISLYAPAMVSIIADGLAIMTIAVATIPLMQKLAFVSAFWIISIFISVVTLHPIILSFVRPPKSHNTNNAFTRGANAIGRRLVTLAIGNMRYGVVALFVGTMAFGLYFGHQLRTGDTSPGMALLYPDHPYNVASAKANHYFVGNSPLVIIAEGKKPGAIKDAATLEQLDLFQRYMEQGEGAGGSVTATTMLKTIFRVFHEGDPKWEMLPTRNDHVGQLFFMVTAGTRRGELDRFFSPDYTNATITVFYKNYDHETIKGAIDRAKQYIATHTRPEDSVRYRLAGGLFGILAAQIEEVDWSYKVNVPLIFLVVFLLSFLTYWSVLGALIVMLPSIVAQPLCEAVMYLMGIDFNINSLPVAAIGIGIGIDYGYYVLSRIVEEYEVTRDFDEANRRALTTTGEAVMFTGLTITTSMVLWLFHPLKFEAQMAFLLMMLMVFHAIGALVFIPAMVSLLRPRFATQRADQRAELAVEA